MRTALENGTVNELVKSSPTEPESGLSENEFFPIKSEAIPVKSPNITHPLSSPSEIESNSIGNYPRRRKSTSSQSSLRYRSNTELTEATTLDRIVFEVNSIALDWRPYQTSLECNCALPFDSAQRKVRRKIEISSFRFCRSF